MPLVYVVKNAVFVPWPVNMAREFVLRSRSEYNCYLKQFVHWREFTRNANAPSGLPSSPIVTEECNFPRTSETESPSCAKSFRRRFTQFRKTRMNVKQQSLAGSQVLEEQNGRIRVSFLWRKNQVTNLNFSWTNAIKLAALGTRFYFRSQTQVRMCIALHTRDRSGNFARC
jgi:hypothetical protein